MGNLDQSNEIPTNRRECFMRWFARGCDLAMATPLVVTVTQMSSMDILHATDIGYGSQADYQLQSLSYTYPNESSIETRGVAHDLNTWWLAGMEKELMQTIKQSDIVVIEDS